MKGPGLEPDMHMDECGACTWTHDAKFHEGLKRSQTKRRGPGSKKSPMMALGPGSYRNNAFDNIKEKIPWKLKDMIMRINSFTIWNLRFIIRKDAENWKSLVLQYKTKDLYEIVRESIENHRFCNIKRRIYVKL